MPYINKKGLSKSEEATENYSHTLHVVTHLIFQSVTVVFWLILTALHSRQLFSGKSSDKSPAVKDANLAHW